jgi:putative spermidine/putrescine transport system permease protein
MRKAPELEKPFKKSLIEADDRWADPALWHIIRSLGNRPTPLYFLNISDYTLNAQGKIVGVPEEVRVHNLILWRTIWLSLLVTVACLLLGYPLAFLLAQLPLRLSNLLMICVLLPFWTALLVRLTAWIALLQADGVILSSLASLGVVAADTKDRPQLVYNLFGTIVAMVHVLLPSMILPLYSVMKTIPPSYMRAARSLGATGFTAFRRVYFPQTLPGISAGALLVFILAVGYYITPAILGGSTGMLVSNLIANYQSSLFDGHAAALATLLLAAVLVLYWLFNKLVGIERLKMG